jgi:hypothetical protein
MISLRKDKAISPIITTKERGIKYIKNSLLTTKIGEWINIIAKNMQQTI